MHKRALKHHHVISSGVFQSTNRFKKTTTCGWSGNIASPDVLDFQVNKDVQFNGVTVYGIATANDRHSVRVQLYKGTARLWDYTQIITSDGTANPITVPIPTSPVVKCGTRYTVKVGRDGPLTFYGGEGTKCVTTEGCTFSYYAYIDNNGTSILSVQIPQILFTKCH